MMPLSVTHDGGDRFSIAIRGHVVHVDQPEIPRRAVAAATRP
jgi:hypothetical protein